MTTPNETYAAIVGATARIDWKDLEPHFARGELLEVDASLDLVEVAQALIDDNSAVVKGWMQQNLLTSLADARAADWHQRDPDTLWAVVIRPWVLVQERAAGSAK
ncbi:hypothetical protein SAMN05216578_101618 [Halopseudomonas formosensis]|uniref:DUF2288 domain-containing protein n=1 Tax=Halopseudomonas formosensis TaxID=1002526 RepID=A0A1I6A6E4_9GAMM|nr:DUF2288 domain-containing protein [Halopseudomonas formosensis]SFQ64228.1 hypothetical protein SAMN05216578_101618 [Halopseudomonas formosensis]